MLRNRRAIVALAFATLFISSVEISHAQPLKPDRLELLVADSTEALKISVPGELEPTWPTLIEMSDRSLVMAWDMLMVSVMMPTSLFAVITEPVILCRKGRSKYSANFISRSGSYRNHIVVQSCFNFLGCFCDSQSA
ncbi:MAG: hypothetical protein RIS32_731 [Actinomycetota bacterium]